MHDEDDLDFERLAEDQRVAKALAAGELELTPVDDPAEEERLLAQLPPPGAPINVIRPVRVPFDVDEQVRQMAAERGVTISAMLRDLIVAGIAAVDEDDVDPAIELRRSLDLAQRAAAALTADRHRDAA